MPEQDLLAKLHDIHLPAPIGWWPLAPGWYVLIVMVLLLLGLAIGFIRHFKIVNAPKKEALALLKQYQEAYRQHGDCSLCCKNISELLRRVALVYYPRREVAGLKGEKWLAFLNNTAKDIDFTSLRELLETFPYQAQASGDLEPLFIAAKRWIEQRRKPCLK